MTTKNCINCKENLPIDMFEIIHKNNKNYYRNKCKICRLHDTNKHRLTLKEKPKISISHKVCIKCNIELEVSNFYKSSISKDGYKNTCITCSKKQCKKNTNNNIIANFVIYCIKCKSYKTNNEFRTTTRSTTGYYKTCNSCWKPVKWNKEKQRISEQNYIKRNPEKIKEKNKKQSQKIDRKIKNRIQRRIRELLTLNNTTKNNKTVKYLGCTILYFKKWLEFQFNDSINWNNISNWHIDHVTPCTEYNLLDTEQQLLCFNWQNLRPCLAKENLEKSNKIIKTLIDSHKELVLKFLEINPLPTQPGDRVEGIE